MSKPLIEKYNNIEIIKDRFLKKSANLSDEQLNKIPGNGGWSAAQVLYHVAYAESGTILVVNKNLTENRTQLRSDLMSVVRNVLLIVFLKLPLKFKAPKVVSKVPDSISSDEIKRYFDKNTLDFKKILQELPVELEDKFIFKHPIGGLFTIGQTLNVLYEHYLHHERQLNALLQ